ncbi:MAG: hypothetical protein ACKO0V_15490, partial [bacterium]
MPGTDPADDELLRQYLRESLVPEAMAAVENRLRSEPALRALLETVREESPDPMVHSVSMAWVGGRLTCPTRPEWARFFSGLVANDRAGYMKFHLEVIECPFCRANVQDMQER